MIVLVLVVLLVALLIPLTAVVLDSQVGRAIAARLEGDREIGTGFAARIGALEGEVERLSKELQRLDDENTFLQQLLGERKPEGLLRPGDKED